MSNANDLILYTVTFSYPDQKRNYKMNGVIDVLTTGVQGAIDTIMKRYPTAEIHGVNKTSKGRTVMLGTDVDLFGLLPQPKEES